MSVDVGRVAPPLGVEAALAAFERENPEHVEAVLRWLVPDEATRGVLRKLVG